MSQSKLKNWSLNHLSGIFIYNLVLMILVLLHGAGYFHPFFVISINIIVFISLVLAIFLLELGSRSLLFFSFIFLLCAAFFKAVHIDIWAERAGIYTFEALLIGVVLLIIETRFKKNNV